MEKIDLSDEEDTSLEATIGYVAEYETSITRAPVDTSGGTGGISGGQPAGESGAGGDHLSSMAALQRDGRLARDTAAAAAAGR